MVGFLEVGREGRSGSNTSDDIEFVDFCHLSNRMRVGPSDPPIQHGRNFPLLNMYFLSDLEIEMRRAILTH